MSAMAQVPAMGTETIQNAREVLALFVVFSVASWALTVCGLLLVVHSLMLWKASWIWSLLGAVQWLFASWCLYLVGRFFWKRGVGPWSNRVDLDPQGLSFHYRQDGVVSDFRMLWGSVDHVTHKRAANTETYKVHSNDGGYFVFTSLTYLRPKTVATRIAEICGKPIQEES